MAGAAGRNSLPTRRRTLQSLVNTRPNRMSHPRRRPHSLSGDQAAAPARNVRAYAAPLSNARSSLARAPLTAAVPPGVLQSRYEFLRTLRLAVTKPYRAVDETFSSADDLSSRHGRVRWSTACGARARSRRRVHRRVEPGGGTRLPRGRRECGGCPEPY